MSAENTWQERIAAGRFTGKTIVVTGAGSGIGKATALRVAKEGGKVIAADISAGRLEELVAENPELDLVVVAGDITEQEIADRVVAAGEGRIDGLANVAGIMDKFEPIHEVEDATWERVFNVNVNSILKLTRGVLPLMLDAGHGAVVNVASEAGLRGSAAGVAYTASKHAVIGMTKNSAVMYAKKGIRFNAVAPGAVQTNIEAPMDSVFAQEAIGPLMSIIPGLATASQLAASITFLLSEDSTNINGVVVASDGGWSAI
ncbi:SDR family NAD(P)-dependent oxidoreductase [Glutamicibacter halophytocola]|uniref:SDR family NAD(P)-dependent oxidoreductase n=1 Tax=Glutamicibacter halophytocola TaxID=1933880 RepID=A0A5B8IM80_9MICC|nr:SDR family NAD(P)-dependent oxidoreductase [Glutamicibacter halophytocola]NQD39892.1 SDR family NAD(P)-dependent oxidoreductase [Glutamicibacter halophytocola]QDY66804.1 SDR family NAD(P)-dependent oxidoreductase [Glutamicibacter halophytocola]UUX58939.1 SDR family NAD(P)-dependent oxidoreductase [Glutamicibacter halophytocola]